MQYTNLSSNGGNKRKDQETRQDKAKFFKQPQFLQLHLVQGVSNWAEMVQNGPKWAYIASELIKRRKGQETRQANVFQATTLLSINATSISEAPSCLGWAKLGRNGPKWANIASKAHLKFSSAQNHSEFIKGTRNHSSLLRTFAFSAISTYNSYLPLIFGTNALI